MGNQRKNAIMGGGGGGVLAMVVRVNGPNH